PTPRRREQAPLASQTGAPPDSLPAAAEALGRRFQPDNADRGARDLRQPDERRRGPAADQSADVAAVAPSPLTPPAPPPPRGSRPDRGGHQTAARSRAAGGCQRIRQRAK